MKDVPYCSNPDDLKLYPGVSEAISKLNKAGFLVIMVTNQSGIGRGYFDVPRFEEMCVKLNADVVEGGGRIDDIFYCPHRPEDHCDCRKPEIGMGIKAIMKYGINPKRSYMIGDHDKDLEFGKRLGMVSLRVTENRSFVDNVNDIIERCKTDNSR